MLFATQLGCFECPRVALVQKFGVNQPRMRNGNTVHSLPHAQVAEQSQENNRPVTTIGHESKGVPHIARQRRHKRGCHIAGIEPIDEERGLTTRHRPVFALIQCVSEMRQEDSWLAVRRSESLQE